LKKGWNVRRERREGVEETERGSLQCGLGNMNPP
jgi:hypothetical protein